MTISLCHDWLMSEIHVTLLIIAEFNAIIIFTDAILTTEAIVTMSVLALRLILLLLVLFITMLILFCGWLIIFLRMIMLMGIRLVIRRFLSKLLILLFLFILFVLFLLAVFLSRLNIRLVSGVGGMLWHKIKIPFNFVDVLSTRVLSFMEKLSFTLRREHCLSVLVLVSIHFIKVRVEAVTIFVIILVHHKTGNEVEE